VSTLPARQPGRREVLWRVWSSPRRDVPGVRAANPPTNKFCHQCGVSLIGGPSPAPLPSPETYTPKHLAEKILTSKAVLEGERKQLRRRTGKREQAQEHPRMATAMYRDMGMRFWREQAEAELH
jgi:hypothetical protein